MLWVGAAAAIAAIIGAIAAAVVRFGARDGARPAPAIVVLGARVYDDGTPSAALCARVEKAAQLYRAGLAPLVVASGGGKEAPLMLRLLASSGVPPSACEGEGQSRNTFENARFTAELLRARGIGEVLLVTDALHMLRAARQFMRAGIAVLPSPASMEGRGLSRSQRAAYVAREVFGLITNPRLWRVRRR